jgi:hypothetical protein
MQPCQSLHPAVGVIVTEEYVWNYSTRRIPNAAVQCPGRQAQPAQARRQQLAPQAPPIAGKESCSTAMS